MILLLCSCRFHTAVDVHVHLRPIAAHCVQERGWPLDELA